MHRPSRAVDQSMNVATYNILKGGSQRVHWVRLIEGYAVDLLLLQESYAHDEHLPPLMYPDAGKRSVWQMAERNGWGSAVYSRTGSVKGVPVPNFSGWVVGARNQRRCIGESGPPTRCWPSASTLRQKEKPTGSRSTSCLTRSRNSPEIERSSSAATSISP